MAILGLVPTSRPFRIPINHEIVVWLLQQRWFNWSDSEKRHLTTIMLNARFIIINPTLDGVWIQAVPEIYSDKSFNFFFVQLNKEKSLDNV